MNTHVRFSFFALYLASTFSACTGGENDVSTTPAPDLGLPSGNACNVTPAAVYTEGSLAANAATELAVVAQFNALNKVLTDAEKDPTLAPSKSDLVALLQAGNPSLATLTTPEYAARLDVLLGAFADAVGETWAYVTAPAGVGGKLGTYLFNAEGTDLRQGVDKGMFGATLYRHALTIRAGGIDAAALDRLLVVYGAAPSFPGVSEGDVPVKDRFAAQYSERRSPKASNDSTQPADAASPGPYFRIKSLFLHAQAALAAGTEPCRTAAAADVDVILREWETSLAATVIYYLNDASKKLGADAASETDLANGLHSYGEAVAFTAGFRGLPADGRIVSDAVIDAILSDLGAPVNGPITSYQLLTDPAATLPKFLAARDKLQAAYGFTAEELTTFETSY